MRVGIKQVAERAGVSATTVSHVVNKTRYVSPEVEKRVNDAIKELNYTPNIMARGLRTNTVKTVAVIVQEARHSSRELWTRFLMFYIKRVIHCFYVRREVR